MKDYSLQINLNPILANIIKELGEDNSLETSLFKIIKKCITIKLQLVNEQILKIEDSHDKKKSQTNSDIKLNDSLEKKTFITNLYNDFDKFLGGNFVEEDYIKYKEELCKNIETVEEFLNEAIRLSEKEKIKKDQIKDKKTPLPIITNENILKSLSSDWQSLQSILSNLNINDKSDARFIQLKLTELIRKGIIDEKLENGKKLWKKK